MTLFKRWRNLLLVALLAAFSFGGSFECHGSSGDHDHDHDVDVD